ncbi:hypothetical protein HUJ04_005832 [Dendroctonus ponderosae]|nr:hypothetical protein HUJ04_005832 [Dendroctonus ponderosae]
MSALKPDATPPAASPDLGRVENGEAKSVPSSCDSNNHFFEEKIKEKSRRFLGILAKFLSKFDHKFCYWGTAVLVAADVGWHVVGTLVVYTEYQPSYNAVDPNYCNRTAYLVAFWTLTIEYTLLLFFVLLSACYMMMRRDFRTESGTKDNRLRQIFVAFFLTLPFPLDDYKTWLKVNESIANSFSNGARPRSDLAPPIGGARAKMQQAEMKTGVFFATLWLFWLHLAWATKYEPNWKSLDKRPLPDWFDKAKIGIFLHWGVFSVPSFGSEWFWSEWQSNSRINSYMKANYPPNFTYQDFAKDFSAEFFNSSQWADLFKRAGANYVVLTSKHHEGFTLWPSEYSFSWNAKDIGPHRDLLEMALGDLGNAVKRAGLKFGVYHSLFEWFNPIYLADKRRNFTTQKFVDNKVLLEMKELVSNYKPWVIWSDGDWEADDTYWRSTDFLAWFGLYNESPVKDQVVVNDRWGRGTTCIHGDFINCHDRYNPGKLQRKKWENAMTLDRESWGFRRNADLSDYLTPHQLLTVLAQTISCGGNLLINLGPTKEGTIAPIFQDRLTQLGAWLRINGEAIYNSRPWIVQNDTVNPQVWYTSGNNAVYAIDLEWPLDNKVILGGAVSLFKSPDTAVSLLGNLGKLKWVMNSRRVEVHLPDKATAKSEGAWVLKIATSN